MSMPQEPLGVPMNAGFMSGRGDESPGLEDQNQRWAALTQAAMARGTGQVSQEPTSVLQQRSLSPNGMSAEWAENRLPNGDTLSGINGMSADTQENYNMTRMVGGV